MLLRCPHCSRSGEHVRSDFFGDWVVCSVCELPFAWREARSESDSESGNGNGRSAIQATASRTRNER
jgi:hypothetical protein